MSEPLTRSNLDTGAVAGASKSYLVLANVVAYALNTLVTYAVGAGGFTSLPTNGEISAQYPTLVTPAGWAFSIWGIIFFAQLVWSWITVPCSDELARSFWIQRGVGYNYMFVCLSQIAWTMAFSFQIFWLSVVCMLLILLFLWKITLSLLQLTKSLDGARVSIRDYLVYVFPFTIHTGWITAATAVNISLLLVSEQVSGEVQFVVAVAALTTLLVVGVLSLVWVDPCVLPLVLVWAYYAIGKELSSDNLPALIVETFSQDQIERVKSDSNQYAIILATLVVVRGAYLLWKRRQSSMEGGNSNSEARYLREDAM